MTMEKDRRSNLKTLSAVSAIALALAAPAWAEDETKVFNIEAQPLSEALLEFSEQSEVNVIAPSSVTNGLRARPVSGELTPEDAFKTMLGDAELELRPQPNGSIVLAQAVTEAPQHADAFRVAQVDQEETVRDIDRQNDDEREFDTIVVTGTNIRGTQNSVAPVLAFDREDIRVSGAATTQEFVRTLPQNLDFSESSAGGVAGPDNGFGGAGAGVNIRGLGASSTLTLVNGRRLAAGAGGDAFVDISLIPLSAIERVEVLTDGASAIYGADAVAGVVNFILRDDYEGAESQVRVGTATQGRGSPQEVLASQTVGGAWSSGNIMGSYEYYRRNNLDSNDRPFTDEAEDPSDLLPNQQRHSILLNARQEIFERLELLGTANFSSRNADINQSGLPSGGVNSFRDSKDKQYGGNIGTQYMFAGGWLINLSGGYNRSEANSLTLLDGELDRETDTSFELWTGDALADGALFELPGGAVRAAVGGHYRSERFERIIERTSRSAVDALDLQRDVFAAFAEVVIPVVGKSNSRAGLHALDVTAAVRFEDFSDAGSSANPQAGLRYSPFEDLSFRGTFSTAFQAPRFRDLGLEQIFSAVPGSFFPAPSGATEPNPAVLAIIGGNTALSPETSRNYTLGVDYTPAFIQNAKISITYFDIDFEDRIGVPAANSALLFTAPETFGDTVAFNPDPALVASIFDEPSLFNFLGVRPEEVGVILDNRVRNLSSTDVRGLDIGFSYSNETSVGEFLFDFNGSYLFDFVDQASAVSDPVETLNTVGHPVDFRFRSGLGWRNGGYGANLFVDHVNSYSSALTGPEIQVDSWTTVDLNFSYDTGVIGSGSLLSNVRASINIQNLFDEEPPFVERPSAPGFDFDGANANVLGRYISFSLSKAW